MPRNTGFIGRQIAFRIHNGKNSPDDQYNAVANVTNISVDGREADEIEFTHLLSDTFKEFRPGFVDPGTITLSIDWNPADPTHDDETGIERLLIRGDTRDWMLDFRPAGYAKVMRGRGFVRSNNGVIPVGDKLTAEVTIRIDGETVWAAE